MGRKINIGSLVEFEGSKGTVKLVISKPSFLIEGLDGKESFVAATEVKALPMAEQISFWRERALTAEGKVSSEDPGRIVSIPGDDENPYTASCTECDFTQQFPDEADAAGDMMKAGWRFEGGSTICPKH
jgi:hypothetical protein